MASKKTEKLINFGLHALIWKEGRLFVAKAVELEVTSQGKTKKEALDNLVEAVELYFEDEKVCPPESLKELEVHTFSPVIACCRK